MDRIEALNGFYTTHDEDSRLTSQSGCVEFFTTVHYIDRYLKKGMRILEIGAGTGRYSHYFAKRGYEVDAVELMECNIDIFKRNTTDCESITITQGDAIDLSFIESEKYDIVLLLGPMYHLYEDEDKRKAMSEAIRVAKKNGIVFSAYCNNDMTVYQFCFGRNGINDPRFKALIDINTFKCDSTPAEIFELYRKEDIDALMSGFNVTRLHYVATDMLSRSIEEQINNMDAETFELYMKFHLCICERQDMVGATNHILDIFRKD